MAGGESAGFGRRQVRVQITPLSPSYLIGRKETVPAHQVALRTEKGSSQIQREGQSSRWEGCCPAETTGGCLSGGRVSGEVLATAGGEGRASRSTGNEHTVNKDQQKGRLCPITPACGPHDPPFCLTLSCLLLIHLPGSVMSSRKAASVPHASSRLAWSGHLITLCWTHE